MAHDVFISYSSKDKAAADAACNVLERNGVRVWIAPRDILPGVGWAESLIAAINNARVMVLVYSSNANSSPQIEREVERAINKGLPVVPFRVEDVAPSATLEYFISETHWLDAFPPPLEHHLERLADAVKRLLASKFVQPGPVEPRRTADEGKVHEFGEAGGERAAAGSDAPPPLPRPPTTAAATGPAESRTAAAQQPQRKQNRTPLIAAAAAIVALVVVGGGSSLSRTRCSLRRRISRRPPWPTATSTGTARASRRTMARR